MAENKLSYQELEYRLDKLRCQKKALESIIETIEDGFIETDLRGNITRFNKAFCSISGYPPGEADGLSYRQYMDEKTALNVYRTFNKVYKTGVANKAFDYEIIRKDGRHRNLEISITPIKADDGRVNGFRCVMRDVTKRKKAENEVLNQRRRLEAIFRSVDDAIITIDTQLNIIEANDAAEKICGISKSSLPALFSCGDDAVCSRACIDIVKETLARRRAIRDYQVACSRQASPMQRASLSCAPLEDPGGDFLGAVLVVRDITRLTDLERELEQRSQFHRIVGKSHKMQKLYRLVEDVSDYEATVLIRGESGTGKELVARAIHDSGTRRFKPFVTVNCSALAEQLLESELFGHVKGSFTGAIRDHIGRFQVADGGTLLLDEIGEISPLIQLKLLRVLQEKEFERVGDSHPIRVDARVIACTHQDLKEKVRRGEFREDLYYRLNVLEIRIPPLRERLEDLPLLVEHFIRLFEKKFRMRIDGVGHDVMDAFMRYPWPGNIRELEHCIERAVILSRGGTIAAEHIPAEVRGESGPLNPAKTMTREEEEKRILEVLEQTDWNKAKSARLLGISRKTLYQKIRKYNLSPESR
jgi:PAS domain S-box-containing protein